MIIYTEDEILLLLKKKDRKAFNFLYDNYSSALFTIINKIVDDYHTSQDVLQEVFVKIWSRIDQYDARKGRLFTWIMNIARNASIDVLRSKGEIMKHKVRSLESVDSKNVCEKEVDAIGVKGFVLKLRPECKIIVEMVYFRGCTIKDVSLSLNLPEGTVKTRLREGIINLRNKYKPPTVLYTTL
jgi:RNA polymerase sigma factor (sigma-70 family)